MQTYVSPYVVLSSDAKETRYMVLTRDWCHLSARPAFSSSCNDECVFCLGQNMMVSVCNWCTKQNLQRGPCFLLLLPPCMITVAFIIVQSWCSQYHFGICVSFWYFPSFCKPCYHFDPLESAKSFSLSLFQCRLSIQFEYRCWESVQK